MTIHQQHHIVENVGGFYCQTCADQAAIEAYLRSELTRAYEELEQERKDIVIWRAWRDAIVEERCDLRDKLTRAHEELEQARAWSRRWKELSKWHKKYWRSPIYLNNAENAIG